MTSMPVLPREVFDEMISELTDKTTLKSCSLVCRSFCRSVQKILFDSIVVVLVNTDGSDDGPSEPITLMLIVEQAPHLIGCIQKLRISGRGTYRPLGIDGYTDLANALGIFSRKEESFPINLRSFWLHGLLWHYIPPRLQDALVLLMTVQSLRDINLEHMLQCPANLIQNLPSRLKHLTLKDTTFSSLPTTRNEHPKLESLTIHLLYHLTGSYAYGGLNQYPSNTLERIVNTTQLKTFQGALCNMYSMPVFEQILRPTSNSLKHLTLRFG